MLKQQFTYEDFNGNTVTEDFYFNLTKIELAENMWIKDKVDGLAHVINADEHTMTPDEIRQVLTVVKDFMRLAYGVKSEDGRRFVKSDEIWTAFTQSAAYDGFLFSLFENPEKANAFIIGLMPKDLAEAAAKVAEDQGLAKGQTITNKAVDEVQLPVPAEEQTIQTKNPKDMTREELLAAYKAKNQG